MASNNADFPIAEEEIKSAADFLQNFQVNGYYKYTEQLVRVKQASLVESKLISICSRLKLLIEREKCWRFT